MMEAWEEKECFLCGRNGNGDPLDRHHIFNGANRKKSEKYGAVIYLCHDSCHIFGKDSVHQNAQTDRKVKQYGQKMLMQKNGWTIEEFIQIFGKNYL